MGDPFALIQSISIKQLKSLLWVFNIALCSRWISPCLMRQ